LREAESLAAALGDARRLGHVSLFLSSHFWHISVAERGEPLVIELNMVSLSSRR
jgi:hypothetical protein